MSGPADVLSSCNSKAGIGPRCSTVAGTYVFELTASDGELTGRTRSTITVNPEPSLDGANLAITVANADQLPGIGNLESVTATLTNALAQPMAGFPVKLTATGANPLVQTLDTDANGVVTFVYRGNSPGTDALHATALGLQTSESIPRPSLSPGPKLRSAARLSLRVDRLAHRQHFDHGTRCPSSSRRASP